MRKFIFSLLTAWLMLAGHSTAHAVDDDDLAWVFEMRDEHAWSWHPAHVARWNRFLERLGVDTGTGVAAMTDAELAKFVAKGWRAWTRAGEILAAHEAPPVVETVVVPEVETTPQPVRPVQAEAQTVPDISLPPADFRYFDEQNAPTAPGMLAWDKWGPWNQLPGTVRQGIHDLPTVEEYRLEGLHDSHTFTSMNTLPNKSTNGTVSWRSDGTRGKFEYVLHPNVAESHRNPVLFVDWDIDADEWSAGIEYVVQGADGNWVYPSGTKVYDTSRPCGQGCGANNGGAGSNANGRDRFHATWVPHPKAGENVTYIGDTWSDLEWDGGTLKTIYAPEGEGSDGLTAQFVQQLPGTSAFRNIENTHVLGHVRRPKIIGTFLTSTGARK